MTTQNIRLWTFLAVVASLTVACGADVKNPLKPPSVYRDPQIHVTSGPTLTITPTATLEPTATIVWYPLDESYNEQALIDEIEFLLDRMETKLDQTNTNP